MMFGKTRSALRRRAVVAAVAALSAVAGGVGVVATAAPAAAAAHWIDVSSGHSHTCGIQTDHTLWCWGDNQLGQLGLGDRAERWLPTRVNADRT